MRQPNHRSAEVWHALSRNLTVLPATHVFTATCMNHASAFPAEAGPRFTDPGGIEGWVDLVGWLRYIPRWFTRPVTVTHPSTHRARCWLTSLIRPTSLAATAVRQPTLSGVLGVYPPPCLAIHHCLHCDGKKVNHRQYWIQTSDLNTSEQLPAQDFEYIFERTAKLC